MHKLTSKPITLDCFEIDDFDMKYGLNFIVEYLIPYLEKLRLEYLKTEDKKYWKELVRWLPEGWLQTRTVTMNYENVLSMIHQRCHHKLNEWSGKDNDNLENFISFARTLPYSEELLFLDM